MIKIPSAGPAGIFRGARVFRQICVFMVAAALAYTDVAGARSAVTAGTASPPATGASPPPGQRVVDKPQLGRPATPGPTTAPVLNLPLSLDQAITAALQYSPAIQQAQQDVVMTQAQIDSAQAGNRPTVSATLFGSRSSWSNILTTPDPTPPVNLMGVPPGSFIDQNVTAMLPVYTGGRVQAAVQAARASRAASTGDLETVREDAALQTRIAYRRVLYQRALIDAQQANLAAAQEQLRLDTVRYQAGKLAEVNLYRDRTLAASAQQEVTNALRDWQQSLYSLETVMGISIQSTLTLTDTLSPRADGQSTNEPINQLTAPPLSDSSSSPSSSPSPDLPRLIETAETHRPELQAARQRTVEAAAQLDRAKAAFRPQVNVMGMGDLTRGPGGFSNGANYTLGVAAGLPLFQGGALSSAQREADAGWEKAKAAEDAVRLQVDRDVAMALANVTAAKQNVTTSQAALDQAQADYSVQQLRFTAGKGIQVEVLDALAALTTARAQVAKARFELAAAQDQLLRGTGEILSE